TAITEKPTAGLKRTGKLRAPDAPTVGQPVVKRRRPSDAELDLPVVEMQLVVLCVCLAAFSGALLGYLMLGVGGAGMGFVVGFLAGLIRHPYLTGFVGGTGGFLGGFLYDSSDPSGYLIAGLAGLALGACTGDWRKLRAPPGSR